MISAVLTAIVVLAPSTQPNLSIRINQLGYLPDAPMSFVVFHDDIGDYSTNEPIMDGTANLTYLLSAHAR